ncbi:acyl-CoA dehydrogenase family protein [Streptomyces sp. NPDC102441]|uniref:acyl-CoA dehydrogenase family protein n=1 Tax=Streptomyces sp. NPDC102441 TaxID=3366176 RepID=UPI0037F5E1A3
MADLAQRYAAVADEQRGLARPVVRELTRAGFSRHFVPTEHGGAAGGFVGLVDAVVELGQSCASAAWCGMLFAAHGRLASYLPEPARRELWDGSPDTLIAAGVAQPVHEARPVPGGYLLSGDWPTVSGVSFADWVLTTAWTPGARGREARLFLVPADGCTVVDTWDPPGMRGTGSNTVLLDEAFVPEYRTVLRDRLLTCDGASGGARCHSVPFPFVAALMFAAPVVGAAHGVLAAWTLRAATSSGPDGLPFARHPAAATALGRASAELRAARLLLGAVAGRADTADVDPLAVAENRRDSAAAVEMCVAATDRLAAAGGPDAPCADDPVHRGRRDVRTAAGHAMLRFDPSAAAYAEAVVGAAAG